MSDAPLPNEGDKVLVEFEIDRVVDDHHGFNGPAVRVWRGAIEFWMPLDWIVPLVRAP